MKKSYKVMKGCFSKNYYRFTSSYKCTSSFILIKNNLTIDEAGKFIKILNKLRS